jgi:hypothetical protein
MDGQVIYDALQQGSAGATPGTVVGIIFLSACFIYILLGLGKSRKAALTLKSKSRATTAIWGFAGRHYRVMIAVTVMIDIAVSTVLGVSYYKERALLDQGNYASVTGAIWQNTAVQVTNYPVKSTAGRHSIGISDTAGISSVHERDRLAIEDKYFYVECDRPPDELHPVSIGGNGTCLPVKLKNTVRVDYVVISPDQYRSEPLRIWLLDR